VQRHSSRSETGALMQTYVVLFTTPQQSALAPPFARLYDAPTSIRAREKCAQDNPSATIVWCFEGSNIDDAYEDYYDVA